MRGIMVCCSCVARCYCAWRNTLRRFAIGLCGQYAKRHDVTQNLYAKNGFLQMAEWYGATELKPRYMANIHGNTVCVLGV